MTELPVDDPRQIPGTPQAAAAEAMGDPEVDPRPYADGDRNRRVARRKARGLRFRLGPEFPGVVVRIRPWNSRRLQLFRGHYERRLRAQDPKLRNKNKELTPEMEYELSRALAEVSITGMEGRISLDGKMHDFQMPEWGDEVEINRQRRFMRNFLPPYEEGQSLDVDVDDSEQIDLLDRLISFNNTIADLSYQEIDAVGEDYVFGATGAIDSLG